MGMAVFPKLLCLTGARSSSCATTRILFSTDGVLALLVIVKRIIYVLRSLDEKDDDPER